MWTVLGIIFLIVACLSGLICPVLVWQYNKRMLASYDERDRALAVMEEAEKENRKLAKYRPIQDVDAAIAAKAQQFKQQVQAVKQELSRQQGEMQEERLRILADAQAKAQEIAGEALELSRREKELRAAVKALENQFHGYGDEYMIATQTFMDELAERYSFQTAGQELKRVRDAVKLAVKNRAVAQTDYVQPALKDSALRFVTDAFNGKVDSVMAKVRQDNYGVLKQKILDAFHLVNLHGEAFKKSRILQEFLDLRLEELKWAVATYELMVRDREEQKRIKQEMLERERERREYEKAIRDAAREEQALAAAMNKVRAEMAKASAEQAAAYQQKLSEMEEKLRQAEERNKRALSMAQQTRSGHVYVISNIGSFGEDVLKIGMTRRLEPLDRVRELGDASVPFPFDVHALIYSADAPKLEHELHQHFCSRQVNKVNPRKEFFHVTVQQVRELLQEHGVTDVQWTLRAEAREYRESLAITDESQIAVPEMDVPEEEEDQSAA